MSDNSEREAFEKWLKRKVWFDGLNVKLDDLHKVEDAFYSGMRAARAQGEPEPIIPGGRYTVEPHGKSGYAIYRGRGINHHGENLGRLSECLPYLPEKIEDALNGQAARAQGEGSSSGAVLDGWNDVRRMASKLREMREDAREFDGDRRGIYDALDRMSEELVNAAIEACNPSTDREGV